MGNYASFAINGIEGARDRAGSTVAGIGDINGDGFDDIAVTVRYGVTSDEYAYETSGVVYVIFGSEEPDLAFGLEDIDGTNGFRIEADASAMDSSNATTFGAHVTGLGDVNGDGVDDFAIAHTVRGYSYSEYYYNDTALTYVIYGGQTVSGAEVTVTDLDHFRIDGEGLVSKLTEVGDVNGDGIADIGVDLRRYDTPNTIYNLYYYDANDDGTLEESEFQFSNYSYVYSGTTTSYVIYGTDEERVTGTPEIDGTDSDIVLNLTEMTGDEGFSRDAGEIPSLGGGYFYGYSDTDSEFGNAGGFDINGDGLADVLVNVGVYYAGNRYFSRSPNEGDDYGYGYYYSYAGTYVGSGNPVIIDGQTGDELELSTRPINNVESITTLGDFSGADGFDELAVAGWMNSADSTQVDTYVQGAYVLHGASDIMDGLGGVDPDAVDAGGAAFFYAQSTYEFNGSTFTSTLGDITVFNPGDFTGDGVDDLIIAGSLRTSPFESMEHVWFVAGTAEARSGVFNLDDLVASGDAYLALDLANELVEVSDVARAGDVNGDGAEDLILGRESASNGDGDAFVLFGGAALEAMDEVDGTDDNTFVFSSRRVDIDTGALPIEVRISSSTNYYEEDSGTTDFTYTITRNGNLTEIVSVDWQVGAGHSGSYVDADGDDFVGGALPGGTVTFAAGRATATITVPVSGDTAVEGHEDFTIELSNPSAESGVPVTIEGSSTINTYILNDDQPASLRIFNASVTEGNPGDDVELSFRVQRTGELQGEVSVDFTITPYSSASISASDADFEDGLPQSGTLTFADGETEKFITLPINEDLATEGTEFVSANLSNARTGQPNGATISQANALGSIIDDDQPADFRVENVNVTESDVDSVTMTFTVTRTNDLGAEATVDFALSPWSAELNADDFDSGYIDPATGQPRSGTLTFGIGVTTQTVTLEVAGDDISEGTEYVQMLLSNATSTGIANPTISSNRAFGGIFDDDIPVRLRVFNASVTEGDPGDDRDLTFTIQRYGLVDVEASIDYSLEAYSGTNSADADDFASGFPATGTITFAAGETSKSVTATVSGDDDVEPQEFVQLVLGNPVQPDGEPIEIVTGTAFGYIYNDDVPAQFYVNTATVTEVDEGATSDLVFRVTRTGDTQSTATVDYSVEAYTGSNAADADDIASTFPTTGTLTFDPGVSFLDITVQVAGDNVVEPTEFIQVALSNPTSDSTAGAVVNRGLAFGYIYDDDVPVRFSVSSASAIEGSAGALTPMVFTVTRSGDTEVEATVDYALTEYTASGPGYQAKASDFNGGFPSSGSLTFGAGETQKQITLQVVDDASYENTEYLQITLSNPASTGDHGAEITGSGFGYGYLYDDERPVYYSASNASGTEKDDGETTTLTFTVYRSFENSAGGSVDYTFQPYRYGSSATNADFVDPLPQSGTVRFEAGETQKQISIDIAGDNLTESTEYFELVLSNAQEDDSAIQSIINRAISYGYIYDDDVPVYFRAYGYSTVEGDPGDTNELLFRVTRYGETNVAASIDYDISGGTADASDFDSTFPTSGTLEFAAGETVKDIRLVITGDVDIENDEYTFLTLSNPASDDPEVQAQVTGSRVYGTIRTDDFPATLAVSALGYVTEGDPGDNTALTFRVTRSGDTASQVTVDYSFAGDTYSPVNAADFEAGLPQSGSLTFAAGETSKDIVFFIAEDDAIEGNERGRLTLSNAAVASGAGSVTIARSSAIGVIYNDDFPPRVSLSVNGSSWGTSVREGNSGVTNVVVTVTRDGDLSGALDVVYDLRTDLSTFRGANSADIVGSLPSLGNTLSFADGEASKTFNIGINGDTTIEAQESFEVRLVSLTSEAGVAYEVVNSRASITIINDDGRPPVPELPWDVNGDGVIDPGETIRVEADVFGDPHIVTLDGLGYDFQAVGEYVLVETEDGATNPFSVQVRFEAFPGSDLVSVTTRMAVEVAGKVVEIDALAPDSPLLIDGAAPTDEQLALGAIDLDGNGTADVYIEDGKYFIVLNEANEQLMVGMLEGAINVCVFLGDPAQGGNSGAVRGLMGNANQDLTDDFGLRDGSDIPEEVISFDDEGLPSLTFDYIYGFGEWAGDSYRDSWALADGEALFSGDTPDFPDGFPAAPLKVENLPADVRAAAEQAARDAGLSPEDNETIFNNAVLDFALTGMGAFLGGATQLAADPEGASDATEAPELAPTVNVTAEATDVTEGDSGVQTVQFTFYRLGDTAGPLEVSYEIQGDVDADDLGDDTPMSGTVAFADGESTQVLDVIVKGDLATEGDEALTVAITGTDSDGVLIGGAQGTTIIETDDSGPVAEDDAASVAAGGSVTGNVLDDNGQGEDSDADGDELTVTQVILQGEPLDVADGPFTLGGGIEIDLAADGSFTFSTGTAFAGLGANEVDSFAFGYVVSDGNGGEDEGEVTITVRGANDAPEPQDDTGAVTVGSTSSIDVLANDTDPDGDQLTILGVQAPAKGSADVLDGEVVFDPGDDFALLPLGETEEVTVVYSVTDGALTADAQVVITVTGTYEAPTNSPPVANDDAFSTDEDTAFSGNVMDDNGNGADFDPDGDGFDVFQLNGDGASIGVEITLASGALLTLNSDGGFDYDPNGAFEGLAEGASRTDGFLYTLTDINGTTDEGEVTITVNGRNDAPIANDDAPETDEDSTVIGNLISPFGGFSPDSDPDSDPIEIVEVRDANGDLLQLTNGNILAAGGQLAVGPDGAFFYDPLGDFEDLNDGDQATVSFTYLLSDGDLTDEATVTININGVNDAPVFTSGTDYEIAENTTEVGIVSAEDVDFGDLVGYSITGGADASLFGIDADTGALRFLSAPDFERPTDSGADNVYEVEVTASDGTDGASRTVMVTVTDEDEDTGPNLVEGTSSFDYLYGTEGADLIRGNGGPIDVAYGYGGPDVFEFKDIAGARDVLHIRDYMPGEDSIDLAGAEIAFDFSYGQITALYLDNPEFDTIFVYGAASRDEITFIDGDAIDTIL